MQTLTIRLPDAAYRAALAFSPQERERLFAVAITTAFAARETTEPFTQPDDEPDYDRPTNEADLEAIGRGLQAEAEGRIVSGDVAFARLREQFKKK